MHFISPCKKNSIRFNNNIEFFLVTYIKHILCINHVCKSNRYKKKKEIYNIVCRNTKFKILWTYSYCNINVTSVIWIKKRYSLKKNDYFESPDYCTACTLKARTLMYTFISFTETCWVYAPKIKDFFWGIHSKNSAGIN